MKALMTAKTGECVSYGWMKMGNPLMKMISINGYLKMNQRMIKMTAATQKRLRKTSYKMTLIFQQRQTLSQTL